MRPDMLPENTIERELTELEALANEFKSKQIIGSSSLVFYTNQSNNTYDWQGNLPPSPQAPSQGTKIINVIATARNMDVLYGEIIGYMYQGSPAVRVTQGDYLAAIKASQTPPQIFLYNLPLNINEKNKIAATAVLNGLLNTPYKAKFFVVGSDEVDIEIVQVN